ncbi:aminotransferase class I/II-fold pyridoxal phosphate-dependent enzyme [Aquitalea sp. USM4]|uniref:aminotransferase class I/II-fold pyridoxal phosphate-dependent enzyme n=1 Tax=Aquitalea sp. USM4 TaxID=1590041 RepID=UPI00103F91E1|nr:aminotransferase class I/II-fold pyridoxal phosphate-dependent enzyme [Aquitalea sp. USM4]QBJ78597.1 8-amino-7-oxononanoate synthase [Aquitalea sp. USM4]
MSNELVQKTKVQLIDRILGKKASSRGPGLPLERKAGSVVIPEAHTRFDRHPAYEQMLVPKAAADKLGLDNPFFKVHEAVAGATTRIGGAEYLNFSSYNYLGLAGHPEVNEAAKQAIDHYGTSASASRLVAGERPIQRELEQELARLYDVEDCVVFVSGHATNVSTIGYLFGPKDLIIHDSLIHNSILQGIQLSGAARRSFPHNDTAVLEQILLDIRPQFERVLIVVEGLYSMDGDFPDLPRLIEIKRRHKAFLMVDEAHALGVLGKTGRGIHEHFGVAGKEVDIWMGTLSKTLASCGGYIAGERALVEHLKYAAPGFVYSVGLSPVLAAASLEALRVMQREPERVCALRARGQQLLGNLQQRGINTGFAAGYSIVPLIIGSSIKAVRLSNQLFNQGINVQPIVYPAVEEKAARLRFFLSALHSEQDIESVCQTISKLV